MSAVTTRRCALTLLLLALALLLAGPAHATVALDAFNAGATGTGNLSWTHTPSGTPRGAIVTCLQGGADGDNSDQISGITYGGQGMTELPANSPILTVGTGTDDGALYLYILLSTVPSGAQTVEVTVTGASTKRCNSLTLTGSAALEVVDADNIESEVWSSGTNPSVTLQLSGRASFAMISWFSTSGDFTESSPLTNWTGRQESDFGSSTGGTYTYDVIGTSDVTAGWANSTTMGVSMIAVAISEVTASCVGRHALLGVGC